MLAPMQGDELLTRWRKASRSRLGRLAFSRALGAAVPYTGSIRPEVLSLDAGRAEVGMNDRRRVRNHLKSVHAIALVNLGEVASGLALLTGLPPTLRGIVKGLSIEYHKKARGRLVASCIAELPEEEREQDVTVVARLRDAIGDIVATVEVRWRVGPVPAKKPQP